MDINCKVDEYRFTVTASTADGNRALAIATVLWDGEVPALTERQQAVYSRAKAAALADFGHLLGTMPLLAEPSLVLAHCAARERRRQRRPAGAKATLAASRTT